MNFENRSRIIPLIVVVVSLQLLVISFPSTARAQVVEGKVYREKSALEVYLICGGNKIWIPTPYALFAMGFDWSSVTVLADGALNAFPRVNIPSLSLTPGSLIFPPDHVKHFPLAVVPGAVKAMSRGKEIQLVELYGWMRNVEGGCNADDPNNNGRDWRYDLELDTDWALAQGIDLNRIFRVGNVAHPGEVLMLPGFHPRRAVGLPLIHIECNSWNWNGANTGRPPPADWIGVGQCDVNAFWPFNQPAARLPAMGLDNPRGPYVRVAGSLVTDNPHDVYDLFWGSTSHVLAITLSDEQEWRGSVPDWNPGLPTDSRDHYARWTEIHPPDLIEIQAKQEPPRVTVRAVVLAARAGWAPFGLWSSCQGVEFDISPPPEASPPPSAQIRFEERRGPETYWPWGEDSNNGSWVTPYDDHVHIKAQVCGGGLFGSPGRFKAIYRVWWQEVPSLLTLTTDVSPEPKPGILQAYTFTVTDAATGASVQGATVTLHNFKGGNVVTNTGTTNASGKVSFTVTLDRKTAVINHNTVTISPTLTVRKTGYQMLSITLLEEAR